jgi:hypothetical protein
MQEELKNCLRLERFSLWHKYFAFLDVGDYLADSLFIKHQVTVKFMQEYGREALPCRMIFCRIRKQDESAFLEALRELPDKMLLCGYPDYPARCRDFMEKVETQKQRKGCVHMMRMTPLRKQNKREQKEYHAKQRGSWNGLCL